MGRLLFWMLLGIVAYVAAKRWAGPSLRRPRRAAPRSEAMVSCAACGLNVPQSEAHGRDGRWYCSREHLERHG
ncbi:MAG TPA: PP0621 family protein [Burkholderiaceae bacterium]|jgi:uncharacterized protein|nr:PP0621 family protein [Burkholderiaceae bacterium]